MQHYDTVILGAGLTGLTTAFYLNRAGRSLRVIEKEFRTGGVIRTIQREDFIFEAGPNTGVFSSPELVRLFDDLKGRAEPIFANEKGNQRWIWKKGRWHALPSGALSAIGTPLFTFRDKLRVLGEPLRKKGSDPNESLATMVRRRLGKSFLDYAVDPFISGIYAGDPEQLITRYALPKLYRLEQDYGSFIRGAAKKRNEPKDDLTQRANRKVFSVKGGLENLTQALTEEVGHEKFILKASSTRVVRTEQGYRVAVQNTSGSHEFTCTHLLSTIQPSEVGPMLSFVEREKFESIASLEYAKVVEVVAAYREWEGLSLNAFGGLIPSREKRQALGILFTSSIFGGRAPEKGAILSVFMGGMRHPEIASKTDEEIREIALREIRETLNTSAEPTHLEIYRYPTAIPQYQLSTGRRLEQIEALEQAFPGLQLGGNIRDGIGMADRVKQGYAMAQKVLGS